METIFFHCLRYFLSSSSSLVEIHFSVQKKKYYFLLTTFFPASGNHYGEVYLKLLSLLLATIFFDFSDFRRWKPSFSSSRKVFLNKFFILSIFFCYWKFNFWKITLFLPVDIDFLANENNSVPITHISFLLEAVF